MSVQGEGDAQHPTASDGATTVWTLLQQKRQEGRKLSKKFGGCVGKGNKEAAPRHRAKVSEVSAGGNSPAAVFCIF